MPELPEVETIRRTLAPHLLGRVVSAVALARRDIVKGSSTPLALLKGRVVRALERKGKQLAILAAPDAALVIHLGMTGQLLFLPARAKPEQPEHTKHRSIARMLGMSAGPPQRIPWSPGARVQEDPDHIHCRWRLSDPDGSPVGTLLFRDPRRFGRLFTFLSHDALNTAWARLGPDALDPPPLDHPSLLRLWRSRRAIKAALLDQQCLAGVGNIYADEALFRAHLHPGRPASRLTTAERIRLLLSIRDILRTAVDARGSTLRDYRTADGSLGSFQLAHQVYGRATQPCPQCASLLRAITIAQRTTVFCPTCQPRHPIRGQPS